MTASRKVIKDVFCWKQKYFWNQYQPSLICQLFPQSLCIIWRISILENRGPQFESMGCQPLSSVTLGSSICLLAILKLVWRRSGQGGGTMSVVGRKWVDFSLESWHLIWLLLGQRWYLWGSSNGTGKVDQRLGWMVVAATVVLSWRQWNFTHAFKNSEGSKKSALSLLPFFRGSAFLRWWGAPCGSGLCLPCPYEVPGTLHVSHMCLVEAWLVTVKSDSQSAGTSIWLCSFFSPCQPSFHLSDSYSSFRYQLRLYFFLEAF